MNYIKIIKKTEFFLADKNIILFWQGICSTDKPNEYLVVGTKKNAYGAIYNGPIQSTEMLPVNEIVFPQSTSTTVYGPEYLSNNMIVLVGSYQTGDVTETTPCSGFFYKGSICDISNPINYFEIKPDQDYKYTIVHSTKAGLAVYISSDVSQVNLILGKSFIYDIDKKITITEVHYPCSLATTTYGIWYNGRNCCTDCYTIAGGFSLNNLVTDCRIFIVDFMYNRYSNKMSFSNWTEIKSPNITICACAQGISALKNNLYVLPIINFLIDPVNNTKLIKASGGRIHVKRKNNKFILVNYESINYPDSKLTIPTSAANNIVVGVSISNNNQVFAFEAVTI